MFARGERRSGAAMSNRIKTGCVPFICRLVDVFPSIIPIFSQLPHVCLADGALFAPALAAAVALGCEECESHPVSEDWFPLLSPLESSKNQLPDWCSLVIYALPHCLCNTNVSLHMTALPGLNTSCQAACTISCVMVFGLIVHHQNLSAALGSTAQKAL